jgi:hypothetical protein
MEKKMNVAEFATLVGATSKTIYQKIRNNGELPVNEQLMTVTEKIKGREITLIITNSEQIEYYKKLYGKETVNDGEYYETLTDNNGYKLVNDVNKPVNDNNNADFNKNMFDRFITVNNDFNNRYEQKITELMKVQNELAEVKSRQLLLEDKAGREGFYINEINGLKKDVEQKEIWIKGLITVIVILLLGLTGYITYNVAVNSIKKSEQVEEVKTPPAPVQVQKTSTKKKGL